MTSNNLRGVTVSGDVEIIEPVQIEEGTVIDARDGKIIIEEGVVIGKHVHITGGAAQKTVIGEKTVLGDNVRITMANIGAYSTLGRNVSVDEASYTGDYAILKEDTVLPKTAKVPSRAVAEGDPFSITRGLTAEELDEAERR
ncbi:MAG: hypothetical protein SPI65_05975 [Peptoniphilus sp.]|nr:hypothetical protein [Peptoniphilus sp.]MDY6045105.1 hypothetical protein [Peptoniphilus sp.]